MKFKRSIRNLISQSHWQAMIDQSEEYDRKADDAVAAMKAEFGDNPKFEEMLEDVIHYAVASATLSGSCMQMSGVDVLEIVNTLA